MRNIILFSLIIISIVFMVKYYEEDSIISDREWIRFGSNPNSPESVQMYYYLDKYSDKYDIPKHVCYNIAYMETKYKGPYDWKYNSNVSSKFGALGPMQIMLSTSKLINKESVSRSKLKNDIEYNVETSMKLLNHLYEEYGTWEKACGAYNTGKPIVNKYAKFCANNQNYKKNWINL